MALIGYHASHEQFPPSELLRSVQLAEQAGFQAAMCSDHFFPWSERQGHSGFAWSWLGAALQATALSFGTVNAPGYRYHPAIIAQAAATLAEMYPGRFWIAVGSGEWMNEHITGERWPPKPERNARLRECVDIMRALWAGETVTHHGLVVVEEAKLYTRSAYPPTLVGAAISAETAEWMGGWADALITVDRPDVELQPVIDAWRRGGGDGKPMYLQAQVSYAIDDATALRGAYDQWRNNVLPSPVLADLKLPSQFDQIGEYIQPHEMTDFILVSSDAGRFVEWLGRDLEMGFERVYVHNVNCNQERFIEFFGQHVLPQLAG